MTTDIIAITNQKGGVGKTTTAMNLSAALAVAGFPTLLIDFDPQGNASTGLGVEKQALSTSLMDLFMDDQGLGLLLQQNPHLEQLYILPSDQGLAGFETSFSARRDRHHILKRSLKNFLSTRHPAPRFVLIDCPPSLNLLTLNALNAANSALIPMQCEFYSLQGLTQLRKTVELVRQKLNPGLQLKGILLTMMDQRNRICVEVEQEVRNAFKELVFSTVIPRNIRLSEAPSHGLPALLYDHRCAGSRAYAELAGEFLQKMGQK